MRNISEITTHKKALNLQKFINKNQKAIFKALLIDQICLVGLKEKVRYDRVKVVPNTQYSKV